MDKKRIKTMKKVLASVKLKYPEMMEYIEENIKKVCESEKMPMEEVFYFFPLLFEIVGRWSFSCISCFVLKSKKMRYLNFCGEAQSLKNVNFT